MNALPWGLWRERSSYRQGHVPRKKKIREGFTLDLRQDSPINILCREGDRGLGKGVCCQGVAAEGT